MYAFYTELITAGRAIFKTNGKEHCFLEPAKLLGSAILNNFVNKIITAFRKSLKFLL